ncbi:hypothetical protein TNCT_524421 [Trichonephila clavata]|uniref:Uncharacterized protein n=1 Tax=Trichonephila clavata TaxID=2740835 RepID=A0A8X6FD09_TRICU|nr:hypothetical protein TNCT_524421 [Trichonephila clavata]
MPEWIVDKRRSETCNSYCSMCHHKRLSYTIDADANIEAISSSTCIISTNPAADVLTLSLIHSIAFLLLRPRNCLIRSYGILMKNLQWNVRSLYNLPPLHLRSVRGDDIRCRDARPRGVLPHKDTRPLR